MKVLVIGGGGREHAIAWKLKQSPLLTELFCMPGNAGTSSFAKNVSLENLSPESITAWAKQNSIDFTVVGPEAFLADGVVDEFQAAGLKIFGPSKEAAQLESSKAFSKEIMVSAGVPTAKAETFTDFEKAHEYVLKQGAPIVIKADGLAAGKGVVVAMTLEDAVAALENCLLDKKLGQSGAMVVVEEFLQGKEASAIAIVDGEVVKPFVLSQDYKRQLDGNAGPNTGGMGAVSPSDVFPESKMDQLVETVFLPTIRELKKRGIYFRGFLYAGILVKDSDKQPYVIEFNCRLGDPETQVILPRLESDLLEVLLAAVEGRLASVEMSFSEKTAATVVMASAGYPAKVDDGKEILGLFEPEDNRIVFHAGTKLENGSVVSKGGRILAVTGLADNLENALEKAYQGVSNISFSGAQYRKDIGGSNNG